MGTFYKFSTMLEVNCYMANTVFIQDQQAVKWGCYSGNDNFFDRSSLTNFNFHTCVKVIAGDSSRMLKLVTIFVFAESSACQVRDILVREPRRELYSLLTWMSDTTCKVPLILEYVSPPMVKKVSWLFSHWEP